LSKGISYPVCSNVDETTCPMVERDQNMKVVFKLSCALVREEKIRKYTADVISILLIMTMCLPE
jgi:cyanophycinase-like exopeptidase